MKKCERGISCKKSCIAKSKTCKVPLPKKSNMAVSRAYSLKEADSLVGRAYSLREEVRGEYTGVFSFQN